MIVKDNIFGIEPVVHRNEDYKHLTHDEIYEVIETLMHLNPADDLAGIQFHGPNPRRVDVAAKCLAVWEDRDLYEYINKEYELENGRVVLITRPYEEYILVRAKRMPMYWERPTVKRILSYYGDVQNVHEEIIRGRNVRDGYQGLRNGNWIIKMKIHKHIPCTLSVSGERFEIYYPGQLKTCWRCGMAHMKSECKTLYKDFINRYDIEKFPELPLPQAIAPLITAMESEAEEETEDIPVETVEAVTTNNTQTEEHVDNTVVTTASAQNTTTVTTPTYAAVVTQSSPVPTVPKVTPSSASVSSQETEDINVSKEIFMDASEASVAPVKVISKSESVKTVNSLPQNPKSSTLNPNTTPSDSELSDGLGFFDKAYQEFVVAPADVHHAENSQNVKEAIDHIEDEDQITPAQRHNNVEKSPQQEPENDEIMTVEVDPEQFENLFKDDGKLKRPLGSSDEDTSTGESIMMNIGSFVNSFLAGSQEKKKAKTEVTQHEAEDQDNMIHDI